MAKVFLDTNAFIDLSWLRNNRDLVDLDGHDVFVSPLSVHILFYSYKQTVPQGKISQLVREVTVVDCNEKIVSKALLGPTRDFEDNIQLHSAAQTKADYFLTSDKKLLRLKFFGETEVVSSIIGLGSS